ncbi:MAG TPA: protein translocase subunit SecD [Polyangiaceae bacterium]|nr:protein translocase subunit SecD [Polyangiaceae bacterium]
MTSSRRNALILIAVAIAGAYAFHRGADNFWGVVVCGLVVVWALFSMLPVMDSTWRLKVGFVAVTFVAGFIALWPTLDTATDGKLKCPSYVRNHITFGIAPGLDLRGGLRLVYTVEVEEAIRDKRDNYANDMRNELATIYGFHSGEGLVTRDQLAKLDEKVHVSMPESNTIRLKFTDPNDVNKLDERYQKKFATELSMQRGPGEGAVTFKIRTEVESSIREKAVSQAKDTVNKRVDELGLREASVTTRDEDIIVEVPGENQAAFDEIKDIIRRTARLEFKMVDEAGARDFFGRYKEADDCKPGDPYCLPPNQGFAVYDEDAPDGPGRSIKTHFIRVQKQPNETQAQALERLKKWASAQGIPDDHEVGYEEVVDYDPETLKTEEKGWRTFYLYHRAEITGDLITDASVNQDTEHMGGYLVAVSFNNVGAERFEEVTGANVQRRFAIILDDVINSAPVIRSKIGGGHATITLGEGDPEVQLAKARKLELVLRSGALPAPISPSNESLIGPSLGKDAIHQGVKGMLVGVTLVLAFMIFYYRKSGVVADIAVLFNLMLQMAILASFSATMTLPGIAGLALTIGMAVDANVLINERIREELRAGRGIRAAVEAGYDKAFSSIIDGHVTVLISGLILAQYGTGPVKGFAVALIVGIIASLYTGVFCTRLVFDWWTRHAKIKRLSVGAEF